MHGLVEGQGAHGALVLGVGGGDGQGVVSVQQLEPLVGRCLLYTSSRIENTIYYDGGSAALYCHRYVRDTVMRTDTLGSDNQVQSTRCV